MRASPTLVSRSLSLSRTSSSRTGSRNSFQRAKFSADRCFCRASGVYKAPLRLRRRFLHARTLRSRRDAEKAVAVAVVGPHPSRHPTCEGASRAASRRATRLGSHEDPKRAGLPRNLSFSFVLSAQKALSSLETFFQTNSRVSRTRASVYRTDLSLEKTPGRSSEQRAKSKKTVL